MTFLDHALAANEAYARDFDKGSLNAPPAMRAAVLTCMDARLLTSRFLGFEEGDVHVIRNAGGRASLDAIRSLMLSSHILGTREYLVVHHTGCGLMMTSEDELRQRVAEQGVDAAGMEFLTYTDLDQSVRDDLAILAASPLLPAGIPIGGLVYDVFSGRLRVVEQTTTGGPGKG